MFDQSESHIWESTDKLNCEKRCQYAGTTSDEGLSYVRSVRKVYQMWDQWERFDKEHSSQHCAIKQLINAKYWSVGIK